MVGGQHAPAIARLDAFRHPSSIDPFLPPCQSFLLRDRECNRRRLAKVPKNPPDCSRSCNLEGRDASGGATGVRAVDRPPLSTRSPLGNPAHAAPRSRPDYDAFRAFRCWVASGDFACNLYWQSVSLYLLFFYNRCPAPLRRDWRGCCIWAARCGTGRPALVVGVVVQRRAIGYRRIVAWGSAPLGIAFALLYWPGSPVIALFAIQIAFRTLYAIVNIPYASWSARVSDDSRDRTILAGLRMLFGAAGSDPGRARHAGHRPRGGRTGDDRRRVLRRRDRLRRGRHPSPHCGRAHRAGKHARRHQLARRVGPVLRPRVGNQSRVRDARPSRDGEHGRGGDAYPVGALLFQPRRARRRRGTIRPGADGDRGERDDSLVGRRDRPQRRPRRLVGGGGRSA